VDERFFINYVSDKRIVGNNWERGDIFIFDGDGKVISFFNHKGNSGIDYRHISALVFDERRKELFVLDAASNRCAVYSEDGKFLRQLNFPDSSSIAFNGLYNFDEKTLLAYNRHLPRWDADGINQRMPYVFLSKEDASVVSRVDLTFSERISDETRHIDTNQGMRRVFSVGTNNIVKYGQEFIIADRSSDTVYLLTQDKKITPLFVRTPSVFDTDKIIYLSVHFRTDRYVFFGTSSYDFTQVRARIIDGQSFEHLFTTNSFAYDLHTGQIFTPVHSPRFAYMVDAPENTNVRWFSAGRLLDWLEEGRLDGRKLKQIAQAISEEKDEVNPVIEIAKLK
jgi:hypothetical protein